MYRVGLFIENVQNGQVPRDRTQSHGHRGPEGGRNEESGLQVLGCSGAKNAQELDTGDRGATLYTHRHPNRTL